MDCGLQQALHKTQPLACAYLQDKQGKQLR
jgi:hypothetical protein